MNKQKFFHLAIFAAVFAALVFNVSAQKKSDLSIAGVKLGDRVSAKAFLEEYSWNLNEKGRPVFSFYNKSRTEVLKFVAESEADLYFIVEMELFAVNEKYRGLHYRLEKIDSFETENGLFVDLRQSATSLIFGVPNRIDKKDLISQKGTPNAEIKKNKRDVLSYEFKDFEISESEYKFNYSASYEFYKNTLKRISLKISVE